nr:hypothetical protein [Bradyrhizobium sp. CCBAU 051011]
MTDIERSLLSVELKPDLDQATDGFGAGGGVVSFRPSRDFGQERLRQTNTDIAASRRPPPQFFDFATRARRLMLADFFAEIEASNSRIGNAPLTARASRGLL